MRRRLRNLTKDSGGQLTIDGDVDDVSSSKSASDHARGRNSGRVMAVNVNGQIRVGFTDGADKQLGSLGLEDSSHVLDTQDVNAALDELIDEVKVVLERVLGPSRVRDVTATEKRSQRPCPGQCPKKATYE